MSAIFRHFCVDGDLVYSDFTWDGEVSKERGIEASAMIEEQSGHDREDLNSRVWANECLYIFALGQATGPVFALARDTFTEGYAREGWGARGR